MFKKQYIITIISILILSFLTDIIWNANKNYEYENLGKSIYIVLAYIIALISGIIAWKRMDNKSDVYNFIGTFNIFISIIGAVFIYYDSGNLISSILVIISPTFILGLLIFKDIYLNKKENK